MDIERGCLETLFKKIPHYPFLEDLTGGSLGKKGSYAKIPKNLFVQYAFEVFPQYTYNELENVYNFLNESMNEKYGVFDLVAQITDRLLVFNGDAPQCKYDQILRWRDISFKLGQDLFTTALLAKIDTEQNRRTHYFAWSPIIKTDNQRLHNILNRGMAENHFHLNGSTQIFALSWASLMNNITAREKEFRKMSDYMDPKQSVKTEENKKRSLYNECIIAAFIRLYLFSYMKDSVHIDSIFEPFRKGKNDIDDIDVLWVADLQRFINIKKEEYGYNSGDGYLDYAMEKGGIDLNNNDNRVLTGERKFLYDCFAYIFRDRFRDFEKTCFYIYLLIKNLLRSELIQVNGRLGFKNFSLYQDRKEIFIKKFKQYQYEMVRMALNSTMGSQRISSLEARICPKKNGKDNKKAIKYYDNISGANRQSNPKHFYVFHFPKSPDLDKFADYTPRNNRVRNNVVMWTKSIVQLMETDGRYKYRVKGIDSCSHEIGCRPEVFAESFRYLTNLNPARKSLFSETDKPIRIKATYHVGEDFLDIVDGLRAIDEAILFCNLKRGSRLGHALALGIDTADYYELKNYDLILPVLDIIDDTAWMIERSKEYGICINSSLMSRLERIFHDHFQEVYGKCDDLTGDISTYDYYNSWKLRGDKPYIYTNLSDLKRYLEFIDEPLLQSQYYEINREIPDSIRGNPKCNYLYYCYHYDKNVREKGGKKNVLKVDKEYVNLVKEIQEKMMHEISLKGISIETNPSSNYLIGTIKKYEQHPIFRFNNKGLVTNMGKAYDSSLLSVSINTDDQGVFDTLLENEYALLACALEKSRDKSGVIKYKPEVIYKWVDYIRALGVEQTF